MTEPHRCGFIGILGRPNVGKSTLLNRVLGQKLAIATPKPQTTRDRIQGIRTFPDWQAIFVDTPGIHEAKTRLNRHMVDLAIATVGDVDLCYLLIDVHKATTPNGLERTLNETAAIVEHIKAAGKPAFLVINKIDKLAERSDLFALIEKVTPLHDWKEIVPVSAKKSDNVERLLATTRNYLPEGPPLFAADTLTDRPMRFIAKEIIREQLFLHLAQELPYSTAVDILSWEEKGPSEGGVVVIHANVHVGRASHKPIVVGKGGAQIKVIGEQARTRIERLLERKVFLDLRVKVDEGWVDRAEALKGLGYGDE